MTEVVRETDKYRIIIGKSTMHDGETSTICYKLVNKETLVVETETTVLPQAIEWMDEFTRLLENPKSRTLMDDISSSEADFVKTVQ